MRSNEWNKLLAGLLAAPIPFVVAHAETYLTETQAASVLFPGIRLVPQWIDLTPTECRSIQQASKERVMKPRVRVFWGPHKEAVIIDQVVGKHEFISYAVAIQPDGKIQGIEILDYKETYGNQVRRKDWRAQFIGKTAADPLRIDKDIQNISGATLSSVHVTNGVRRVLHTYEIIQSKA
jgi:Na+-translocating ferredoxin:NAD+ oxidoreductase RnfG subunit